MVFGIFPRVFLGFLMAMGQKENPTGDHRFWGSISPFSNRVFWVPFFDP